MSNYEAYKVKANQLAAFVGERTVKNEKSLCIDTKRGRVTFLSGDRYAFVKTSLEIIQKYINKFFEIRKSDFEARADEYRGGTSANSYAKHMRPSMINEFDRSYISATINLNYNIFHDSIKELTVSNSETFLPRIMKNGSVKYYDDKSEKKEVVKDEYVEVCEKIGPVYAPSLIFYKKNLDDKPERQRGVVEKWSNVEQSYGFKITVPKVVDDKWVNTYQYF